MTSYGLNDQSPVSYWHHQHSFKSIPLTGWETNLHADGRIAPDEAPLVVADPTVVHAVPSIQDGPVCGQLDHHVLSSIAARRLVHICASNCLLLRRDTKWCMTLCTRTLKQSCTFKSCHYLVSRLFKYSLDAVVSLVHLAWFFPLRKEQNLAVAGLRVPRCCFTQLAAPKPIINPCSCFMEISNRCCRCHRCSVRVI